MSGPLNDSHSQTADGDAARYHAVSKSAVAAFLLGLLSPLALVGPVLWLVPLLGIAIALSAMRKISTSAGELVGWNLAFLGLLLAILFGVAAPVHTFTRHHWIEVRAEEFADQFLDLLLNGRTQAAFQLSLAPGRRKPLDYDLSEDFKKNPKAQQLYDEFTQHEPARTLLALRQQAKIEQLSSQWLASGDENDQVAVLYRISQPDSTATNAFNLRLDVMRFVDGTSGREQWQIVSARVVE